jgi:hypothetical protein
MQNKWSLRLKCEKAQNTCKKRKSEKIQGPKCTYTCHVNNKKRKKGCLFISMLKLAPIVFFYFWNNIKIQLSKIEHQATDKTYFKAKNTMEHINQKKLLGFKSCKDNMERWNKKK